MQKLKNWLKRIDDALLHLSLIIFIFLIPLYPKLPLIHVEYTYISIRADDFLISLISLIFLVQLIRKKVILNRQFLIPIFLFWGAVLVSFIWSNYVVKTMPYHPVSFLHALRRIEYMLVFFIAASSIKSRRDFMLLLYALFTSIFLSFSYAIGQKFFGFPAVQTMNPAFAQGLILILTPEARISGTFAGHYDLAAYIVFLAPLVLGIHFARKVFDLKSSEKNLIHLIGFAAIFYTTFNLRITNAWIISLLASIPLLLLALIDSEYKQKIMSFLLIIASIVVLVFTASRISFGAFLVSTPLLALYLKKYRYFIFIVIFTLLMSTTSRNLTNRFSKTFQVKQILVNDQTGEVYVPQEFSTKELPAGSAFINLKKTKPETKETTAYKERIMRDATASGKILSDEERKRILATLSANIKPVSGIVYDISFATRLQVEWPRAFNAFMKNPLLGTGPFSITEATDNDYLRFLGEFGLLGFVSFAAILALLIKAIYKGMKKAQEHERTIYAGLLFGILGLLLNAGYIDVFEASKIAYVFWYVMGIYIGFLGLQLPQKNDHKT